MRCAIAQPFCLGLSVGAKRGAKIVPERVSEVLQVRSEPVAKGCTNPRAIASFLPHRLISLPTYDKL